MKKIIEDLHKILKTEDFTSEGETDCPAIDEMLNDVEFRLKLQVFLELFRSSNITLEHTIGHLIFMAYRCGRASVNTDKDVEELTKIFNKTN